MAMRPAGAVALALLLAACADATGPDPSRGGERAEAGGATTVIDATSRAYSQPAPNLTGAHLALHMEGDAAFEQAFVRAPAEDFGGLGPILNRSSCVACHRLDGRTRDAFLIRLSLPGTDADGGPLPVPGFGRQLQDQAVFGVPPEGHVATTWQVTHGTYGDGASYTMREPVHTIVDAWIPLPAGVLTSARMPRPVFGLGLLEAVPETTLESLADPDDLDHDGISGRVNRVRDLTAGEMRVGRFGWKANEPSVLQQVAAAYVGDMGITSVVFPQESSYGHVGQDDGLDDDPELDPATLEAVTFYMRTLAVPAPRRLDDPQVRDGEDTFARIGCASCHTPRLVTGSPPDLPEVANQVIWPYTDLLLHDMGPGLSDGRADWGASADEWKTPPLWGVGLSGTVNGHFDLLHDGRARTLEEAILWHGGEAEKAADAFRALPAERRRALIAFLESL